jgi:MATE family multidrug resistance protein
MKKSLVKSYVEGLQETVHGESFGRIMRFFMPEFISSLLLYSMPMMLDAYFIGSLKSTPIYSTLGATNNLIHFIIKVTEGLSVGTMVLTGLYNGRDHFAGVGRVLRDAFWTTLIMGVVFAGFLYFGAHWIYEWYVPAELVPLAVPFLRLRALSILCMFIFMALTGFLRGIKNTRAPMKIFMAGTILFVCCDALFIHGIDLGFIRIPSMGLQGSALASVVQYMFMLVITMGYLLCSRRNRKYCLDLFSLFTGTSEVKRLLSSSWPVVLDKAAMAISYIWLLRMIKPMGTACVATFCMVKDIERFAFLPAIACAQIITFLVSNDFGRENWIGIKSNIKKVTFLASSLVFLFLLFMVLNARWLVQIFDKNNEFGDLAVQVLPFLSVLVFFDVTQLILSGALRGSRNEKTVMFTRLIICFGYFVPTSYVIANWLDIESAALKFVLTYGVFYIGNAFMSLIYINKFRSEEWKKPAIEGKVHGKNI